LAQVQYRSMSGVEDVDSLSLKELKALIQESGLSFADCLDKADLRARAREAQERLAATAAPSKPAPGRRTVVEREMAGYACKVSGPEDVLGGSAAADLVVIMLHGLGATNSDLVEVPAVLGQIEPALGSRKLLWVFPQAPMTPIGAAWFTIDVMKFMMMQMSPDERMIAQLIREEPEGMGLCRGSMRRLLDEARGLGGGGGAPLPYKQVLVSGFSLGAMTALDTALQLSAEDTVAGVVCMSGACIVVEQWAARFAEHRGLRVHLSHGLQDPTLPYKVAMWTRELCQQNGARVTFVEHPGGHDIGGPEVLRSIAAFVRDS